MDKSFSISRKGYNPAEVEEYIAAAERSYNDLRDGYAALQTKYDSLFEENGTLIKEREQLRQNCLTMAAALKQLRENPGEDYKAKYEKAAAQLEELKAQQTAAPAGVDAISASQMIEEVAMVVKRVESDARRKADAITANAKLEQAQAQIIRSRVQEEVKSLVQMLEGFLNNTETEEEETEE